MMLFAFNLSLSLFSSIIIIMSKDFILFDLDGTLTDPSEGITNSLIYALKTYGIEVKDPTTLYQYIGPPLLETFHKGFGFTVEESVNAMKKYREYFSVKGLYENRVYDGIPELLHTLQSSGKTLLVATSKPEEYSVRILRHFSLDRYFTCICGSTMDEKHAEKSYIINDALERGLVFDKTQAVMVGDREHDINGAKTCGITSCGVLYGFGSRKELENAGADFIAEDISTLQSILMIDAQA